MSDEIVRRPRKPLNLPTHGGADQAFRDETNINSIVAQYAATGQMSSVNRSQPLYGDVSDSVDLASAINQAAVAAASFAELPSLVRAAASNDPVEFLAMVADPDGRLLLQDAGLELTDEATRDPNPPKPPVTASVTEPKTPEQSKSESEA